eukprot:m.514899 g.514899  ORF g.514899 m.514899 type:complete len:86 (+) comp57458_c0_seq5:4222-4479(+)
MSFWNAHRCMFGFRFRNSSGSFTWVGKTRIHVRFEREDVVTVGLRACVAAAGVYDMQHIRVRLPADTPLTHPFVPSLLFVNQSQT